MFRSSYQTLFAGLCLASVGQTLAATCSNDPEIVSTSPVDFAADPITVVSSSTESVTFTVSQTWSDDMLCLIATLYTKTDDEKTCPLTANAAPGEFAEYTAKCINGVATVDLYVYDSTFDNADGVTIDPLCEQTHPENTFLYQFEIPCGSDTCTSTDCASAPAVEYNFEAVAQVEEWMFGKEGGDAGNKYLVLDATTMEIAKTFDVPSSTTGLTFEFDLLSISDFADDQKVFIRVGDYYLNITSTLGLGMGEGTTDYYGEYQTFVERVGFSSTLKATVTIPASVYSSGYISLGVRTTGSSDTYVAGVDNVKIIRECGGFLDGSKSGGGGGDPHFQRWGREHSSFHGECDLVMVHSDKFHNGAGLDLHVRTTIQDYFSYIESAAMRVGDNVLEFHKNYFTLNAVKLTAADLPVTFGGDFKYTVSLAELENGKNPKFYQYFKVDLHEESSIIFKFYKQYLTIAVDGHANDFHDSTGLLGDYETGDMIDRDGRVMSDFMAYGMEWQVSPEDPKIFAELRAPQLPFEQCRLPTAARPARRKLRGADAALFEDAKKACSHVKGSDFDLCADDVMATGDVGLASNW